MNNILFDHVAPICSNKDRNLATGNSYKNEFATTESVDYVKTRGIGLMDEVIHYSDQNYNFERDDNVIKSTENSDKKKYQKLNSLNLMDFDSEILIQNIDSDDDDLNFMENFHDDREGSVSRLEEDIGNKRIRNDVEVEVEVDMTECQIMKGFRFSNNGEKKNSTKGIDFMNTDEIYGEKSLRGINLSREVLGWKGENPS